MLVSMVTGLMLYSIVYLFLGRRGEDAFHRVGGLTWGLIGGLLAYIYALLQLPGSAWVLGLGTWAGLTTTLLGAIAGWLAFQLHFAGRRLQRD